MSEDDHEEGDKAWLEYEERISELLRAKADGDALVTFDRDSKQRMTGHLSGWNRQIDVIVRGRFPTTGDGTELTMIVDCKAWNRKIGAPHVEAFAGLVEDVRAPLGLLISTKGFTGPALKRAQSVRGLVLETVTWEDLPEWPGPQERNWDVFCDRCGFYGVWHGHSETGFANAYCSRDGRLLEIIG